MNYLNLQEIVAINERVMAEYGQQALLINQGALESALMRPLMAAQYEDADLVAQATVLIAGIALNHAFVDGNKRTALITGSVFLEINGHTIECPPNEFAYTIEALVTHGVDMKAFAAWIRAHIQPFSPEKNP